MLSHHQFTFLVLVSSEMVCVMLVVITLVLNLGRWFETVLKAGVTAFRVSIIRTFSESFFLWVRETACQTVSFLHVPLARDHVIFPLFSL